MKLKEKDFAVNQMGRVTIIPEESDDLWILYNIINSGDYVMADTSRKVHHQLNDSKNTTASHVRLSVHLKAATSSPTVTSPSDPSTPSRWSATNPSSSTRICPDAELAVTLFQQDHAEIYLIEKGVTAMVSNVETSSSRTGGRKSSCSSPSSNTKNVFFCEVFAAFIKHMGLNKVKNTVIASKDSKKDEF
ncbi:hypothetical protein HN51_011168 [Arachis hypogaea]